MWPLCLPSSAGSSRIILNFKPLGLPIALGLSFAVPPPLGAPRVLVLLLGAPSQGHAAFVIGLL